MKKLLFLLLTFMLAVAVNAEQVSRQEALQRARQFMPGKQFGEVKRFARAGSPVDKEPFYIFNTEGQNGFVIISGDDRTQPVLAYAEQGSLEEGQMPDNMKWWLDNLARQIEALGSSLKPAEVTSTRSGMTAIAPLIQTEWDQGAPYNYMCPDGNYLDKGDDGYDATNLCVTGCVATAMAQVLYYWKWPNQCAAIDSYGLGYYDSNWNFVETNRVKGVPATQFKWEKMKTKYGYNETGEAADAVAELMRYCGQAVHMGYDVGGSGANLSPSDLASVFNYSPNIRLLTRDYYTTAQWEALVYEELSAEHPRPVLYSGRTSRNEGHQFIIDGYDGNGLFHINWGWGYGGSYSVLSLADPNTEHGIGGSSNNGAFQYEQDALFGVKPAEAGEVMMPVLYGKLGDFLTKTYTRTGIESDFTDVTLKATVVSEYSDTPETMLDVQVGWGLYQNDQLISCLGSNAKTLCQHWYDSFANELTMSFGKNLAAGKYQLTQIYRFSDSEAWKRCEDYGTNSLVAEISATSLTVRKPALDNMSFTVNSITTSEQPEVDNAMDIYLNVTNTGESSTITLNLWLQKSGTSTWTNVVQGNFHVDPGQSTDIKLSYTPTEAGTFTIKATGSSDDALGTATVTIAATETVTIDEVMYLCTPLYERAMVVKNKDADKSVSSITIQQTITASGVACQVKAIADEGLRNFWNISQLEIPEGVESVGKWAVSGMSDMTKLTLPSTLKSIGDYAFANNNSLEAVVSHVANPCEVSDNVFQLEVWNNQEQKYDVFLSPSTLYVPVNSKAEYETAGWTAQFTKVEEGELMEGFDGILKYAYSTGGTEATVIPDDSYQELTEVTIPATATLDGKSYRVTAVGNNAFRSCNKLTSLTLPEGLVSIGHFSFQSTIIKDILFPASLKSIGDYAFMYCNLNTVSLPEGLESIGDRAFYYMSNLKKVELPSSITVIGDYAFYYNQNLLSVESHIAEPFDISESVFAISSDWDSDKQEYNYSPSSAVLYVPTSTKSKYLAAKGWNMFAVVEEGELKEEFDGILKYSYLTGGTEATVIQDDSYQELTEVTIPATATLGGKTYQVTAVGNDAFKNCSKLTYLTLSDGLVSIGKYSFYSTGIKELVFPTTLTSIGDNAFTSCAQISTIVLPEGLESVGKSTFNHLSSLKKVLLSSSIISIGDHAFYNNLNLSSVESHIVEPFDIPESAFAGSSTYDYENYVYIYSPSSATLYVPINTKSKYVAAKGWNMFAAVEEGEPKEGFDGVLKYSYSTGSTEATVIPDDSYLELTEVTIPATATLGGKTYHVTTIGNDAFKSCSKLTSLTLSEGLVSIGKYSFYNTGIKEIAIPTTVKSVGDYAFQYCSQIHTIILPEGLESIGSYSFNYMSNLQKVILPSSLTSIDERAFFYCQNLSSVESHIAEPFDIPESVFAASSTWDSNKQAYDYTPSSAILYVPTNIKSKYAAAKGWNMFAAIEEGELKEGFDGVLKYSYSTGSNEATVIQDDSYRELTEVTIPATATLGSKTYQVKAVGNDAFKNCSKLTSLTLSEGLASIGNNAFQNTRMSSVSLPGTLRTIGNSAFEDCYCLTSVVIPEGVEKIGSYAFSYMGNLEKITLPSTLKEIGSRLLLWDTKLTIVVSNISEPFAVDDATFIYKSQWNSESSQYDYTPSSAKLYVPKGKVATYQSAGGWNWFAGIEEIKSLGMGDVNGDGFVDADDVRLTADYIMGKNPPGFVFANANINGDSKVDAADLVLLVNMVKSLQSE